jgi:hypothetical protein
LPKDHRRGAAKCCPVMYRCCTPYDTRWALFGLRGLEAEGCEVESLIGAVPELAAEAVPDDGSERRGAVGDDGHVASPKTAGERSCCAIARHAG